MPRSQNGRRATKTARNTSQNLNTDKCGGWARHSADILRPDFGSRAMLFARLTEEQREFISRTVPDDAPDWVIERLIEKSLSEEAPCSPGAHPFASDITPEDRTYTFFENVTGIVGQNSGYKLFHGSVDAIRDRFFGPHRPRTNKDGHGYTPGLFRNDSKERVNAEALQAFVFDCDHETEESTTALIEQLEASVLAFELRSSHNHRTTETKKAAFKKFCAANGLETSSPEAAARFLREKFGYPESVVGNARVVELQTSDEKTRFAHGELWKLRIAFFIDEDYVVEDVMRRLGVDRNAACTTVLEATLDKLASSVGIVDWDRASGQIERGYYAPSCPPLHKDIALSVSGRGACVSLSKVLVTREEYDAFLKKLAERKTKSARANGNGSTAGTACDQEFNVTIEEFAFDVGVFWKQGGYAGNYKSRLLANYQVQSRAGTLHDEVSEDFDRGATNAGDGVNAQHLWCPFEDEHSGEGGGAGFFIADASDNNGRAWFHCCHTNSCLQDRGNGKGGIEAPHYVKRYLELGLLTLADLRDRSFYAGGKVPDCVRVLPTKESIEAAIAALTVNSKSDVIDPILDDLAWFNSGSFTSEALDEICAKIGKKRKTDYRDEVKRRAERLGNEVRDGGSREDAEAKSTFDAVMAEYVRDCVIIMQSGKGYVLDTTQDVAQGLMPRDDFMFRGAQDWVEVTGDDKVETLYPAKVFVNKPPKSARRYKGGLVFLPEGSQQRPTAQQFNLYKGIQVKPDDSGSCSLVHELLRDVWAHGREAEYLLALEWFFHILRFPGDRVGTSLALRGVPGDGKGIMFEKLMASILGDMNLVVADEKLVLGDFNGVLLCKLLVMADEAAFAGNKKAFDKGKSLITAPKIVINQKHKAEIVVEHFARFAIVSNAQHFAHIEADDRRYTVFETNQSWNKRQEKFDAMIAQWESGGKERFMWEALNHDFRQLPGGGGLVVSKNLKTKAAKRQQAFSRSSLHKCIVRLLLDGNLEPGNYRDEATELWSWDEPWQVGSLELERLVTLWLEEFDERAARFEVTQHSVIEALESFVGKTKLLPRKTIRGAHEKRTSAPTMRQLPSRRLALWHAWKLGGPLTDEEFEAAGGDSLALRTVVPLRRGKGKQPGRSNRVAPLALKREEFNRWRKKCDDYVGCGP